MPGLKRPSLELESSDDESPSTYEHSKRARLSESLEDDRDGDDDDDEDLSSDGDGPGPDGVVQRRRPRANGRSRIAENGIIESLTCTNFMCHTHLHVDLGPLVNFVIGHNGSGKSAVLTALAICLGGKASSTNRANTLRGFIKEGQDSCTLVVRIKNKDGYQHEVYGDTIVVERAFSKTGNGGFKIKNCNGKTIATTKSVLDDILDYYALTFDNPICVLTQDKAREFLNNATPTEKYKFFIKGVQLEQLNQDYELLLESIDHIEAQHDSRVAGLSTLEAQMKESQRRLDMINRQDSIARKCDMLGAQQAWCQVEEKERELEAVSQSVREADARIQEMASDIQAKSAAYDQATQAYSAAEAAEITESGKLEPIQAQLSQAKSTLADAEKEVTETQTEQRQNKSRLVEAKKKILTTEKDIAEEQKRLDEASGGTAAARFERLEAAKNLLEDLQQQSRMHNDLKPGLEKAKADANQKLRDFMQGQYLQKENEVKDAEMRLKSLQNDRNQNRDGFPAKMRDICAAIDNSRDFRQKPIGPIGKHIRLLDPKWSSILEKQFGGVINGFIVSCREDRDKLSAIMRRHQCSMTINILSARERFTTRANEPGAEYNTIARSLNIDNDLVFNHMIISQRIEQILLVENEEEGNDLMSGQRIPNVQTCLTLDQTQVGVGHVLRWNTHGAGIGSTFIDRYNGHPRMKVEMSDQIRLQEEVVNKLRDERRDLDQRKETLRKAFEACGREVTQHAKVTNDFRNKIGRAQTDVESVQDEIDNSTIEEGRLNTLQEALTTAKKQKQQEEEAAEDINLAKEQQIAVRQERANRVEELEAQLANAKRRLDNVKSDKTVKDRKRHEALLAKNRAIEAEQSATQDRDELVYQRHEADQVVQAFIQQASEYHEQRVAVPAGETTESIKTKLNKLLADIDRYERQAGGSKEQISREHLENVTAFSSFQQQMKTEEDLLVAMKKTWEERQDRWKLFRKYISTRARNQFMYLLAERGFKGALTINHETRQLDTVIQPNSSMDKKSSRKTHTLSGGEKSFTSICLILALWEAICAPVRCLDEYDVFMDSANRAMSTKLLINAANDAPERQFIFITPQAMAGVDASTDLRIIRMADPERGQQVLSFNN